MSSSHVESRKQCQIRTERVVAMRRPRRLPLTLERVCTDTLCVRGFRGRSTSVSVGVWQYLHSTVEALLVSEGGYVSYTWGPGVQWEST